MSELSIDEKEKISHRGNALRILSNNIKKFNKI
jgi:inosine/xanthosine triphosphate pyrophosphatase family protein